MAQTSDETEMAHCGRTTGRGGTGLKQSFSSTKSDVQEVPRAQGAVRVVRPLIQADHGPNAPYDGLGMITQFSRSIRSLLHFGAPAKQAAFRERSFVV